MKKIYIIVIGIFCLLLLQSHTFVDSDISVYLDGMKVDFDVQPKIINNRTMVPIRAIFETLGADVSWDENDKSAICIKDDIMVKMTVDKTTMYINGKKTEMDVAPIVIDGRTLAPIRYAAESFNLGVDWDAETRSIRLYSKDSCIYLNGEKYGLTFYDDFDTFDEEKWAACPDQQRGSVGGWWNSSQFAVNDGKLILYASLDENGTPISGAVRTKYKFQQRQGYFEARCKVQSAEGFWAAFWLMCDGEKLKGNGATDGAEFDIFESFDVKKGKIDHVIHWDGYAPDHPKLSKTSYRPDCYEGFHTYSLLWTDTEYIFYVDGEENFRVSSTDADYPGNCSAETHLILSVESGNWAGKIHKEQLPDEALTVDYVKVYKKLQ